MPNDHWSDFELGLTLTLLLQVHRYVMNGSYPDPTLKHGGQTPGPSAMIQLESYTAHNEGLTD